MLVLPAKCLDHGIPRNPAEMEEELGEGETPLRHRRRGGGRGRGFDTGRMLDQRVVGFCDLPKSPGAARTRDVRMGLEHASSERPTNRGHVHGARVGGRRRIHEDSPSCLPTDVVDHGPTGVPKACPIGQLHAQATLRRGRDSNPRWAFDPRPLSKRLPSATRSPLP